MIRVHSSRMMLSCLAAASFVLVAMAMLGASHQGGRTNGVVLYVIVIQMIDVPEALFQFVKCIQV